MSQLTVRDLTRPGLGVPAAARGTLDAMSDERLKVPVERLRFDVLIRQLEDGRVELIPDPRRYEWKEGPDGKFLFDKESRLAFPVSVLADMFGQVGTVPVGGPSPVVDLKELISERSEAMRRCFAEPGRAPESVHLSDDELARLVGGREGFAVLCVDAVGSTRLAALDPRAHERLMPAFCSNISEVIGKFGGFVANFGGDGGVFFFPPQGFCAANDAAFDAATAVVAVHYAAFCTAAADAGLPVIDLRVGADSGDLAVQVIGSALNQRQPDIFGLAASLAAKVQVQATPGYVYVGEGMFANLHVTRQNWCEPVDLPRDWPYEVHEGVPYRLFRSAVIPPKPVS